MPPVTLEREWITEIVINGQYEFRNLLLDPVFPQFSEQARVDDLFAVCSLSPGTTNREVRLTEVVWYRAMCFATPVGPWRDSKEKMRSDLMARGLGSYDEWGCFYVTVPGAIQIRRERLQSRAA